MTFEEKVNAAYLIVTQELETVRAKAKVLASIEALGEKDLPAEYHKVLDELARVR